MGMPSRWPRSRMASGTASVARPVLYAAGHRARLGRMVSRHFGPSFRTAVCLLLALLGPACAGDAAHDGTDASSSSFPKDFMFGAAIAGFQADMGCPTLSAAGCVDRNS